MKFINLLTAFMLVLLVQVAVAQDRTINGTVTDSNTEEPIVGATVIVPGSTIGTVTDLDGQYELKVPASYSSIQISFIGYKPQTFELGASNVIDAALGEDVLGLSEVVVTAIGITRERKALGYSVEEVGGSEITQARETNVVNALAGKVAGVQITSSSGAAGGASNIRIRGANTIQGDNDPLFVVDGIPIDNSQLSSGNPDDGANRNLSSVAQSNRAIDIPQEDIESISVLKGAAATALYGSQAGNGAIIITTKKGKKRAGGGLNINYNVGVDFSQYNKMHEFQNQWAQGLFGSYSGPETGSGYSWGPAIDTLVYLPDPNYPWDKNGRIVGQSENPGGQRVQAYDNINDFFQTGVNFNNSLSLSSANDVSSFYLGLGYQKEQGIIPNNTFEKINVTFNGEVALTPKFKVGTNIKYINSGGVRIEQGSNTSGVMLGLTRTTPTFDNSNGFGEDAVDEVSSYTLPNGGQRNYRGGGGYDNPFWAVNNTPLTDDVNRVIGSLNFAYDFADWIKLTYKIGTDFYSDRRKQSFAIGSRAFTSGLVREDQYFQNKFNADLILSINKQLSDDLRVGGNFGHNMRTEYLEQLFVQGDGLVIPGFEHISNASNSFVRENIGRKREQAFYGMLEFDYKRMLYLTLTYRSERSTTLPEGNDRFDYPSASLAFVFTEALGLTDNPIIPFGKLRASWAKVGLGSPYLYATANYFTQATYADGWTNGIAYPYQGSAGFQKLSVLGNPDLGPEENTQWEIGMELKFLQGRLGLDVSYYNGTTTDLIFPVPVTAVTGYRTAILNSGEMTNNGIEVILNATPVEVGSFAWDIDMNYTRNRNEVVKLADGVDNVFLGGFQGSSIRAVEGQPYGSMFGNGFYRDASGARVIDSNGFPIIDPDERAFGSALPDWTMGIRNTFSYKGLSVSALLDIKQGGILWNGTKGALYFWGTAGETSVRGSTTVFEGNVAVYDADGNLSLVDHDNDPSTADIPQTSGANSQEVVLDENWLALGDGNGFFGSNSEDFIEDASWVRLRELSLSYSLPSAFVKKTPFSNIDLTITGRNVWLQTDYTGIDPETSLVGSGNAQGLEYFNMPNTKSWGVGLRIGL
ncbi:MAG: SusC/RagA family TonB-linked outer membrane protein [Chitinophagales bacterium]